MNGKFYDETRDLRENKFLDPLVKIFRRLLNVVLATK